MPQRRTKGRKLVVIFSSILMISLVLMTVNIRRGTGPLFFDRIVMMVTSPIQNLFTQTVSSISDVFNHYFFLVGISRENERLLKEIDHLAREKNELKEQVHQYQRLAKLLGSKENPEQEWVVASVIARDATQWSKMVFIDKGTKHGIHENLAVVSDAGIIGHVIQSTGNTSKVLLITDSRSAVDALLKKTRVPGVAVGNGTDVCEINYVSITAEVEVGDQVLSSGLGGIYPKGLMIGTITKVTRRKQGLFQDITLVPSADLARLEEVLVLLS